MSEAVPRHMTAMTRNALSRPLRTAIEDGLMSPGTTVTDYGCGRGGDARRLSGLGFDCAAWDPAHAPAGERRASDVVNIGYVVNVIEDPGERAAALQEAWRLARRVLLVSARLSGEAPDGPGTATMADGIVTRLGTFQKFYEQHELRTWIDATLEEASIAAAPGIFYVFRDVGERSAYMASRFRQPSMVRRVGDAAGRFEENRAGLEALARFLSDRGRLPVKEELSEYDGLVHAMGSIRRAFEVLRAASPQGVWDVTRETRSQDLLVYLALSRFDRRPPFGRLPVALQLDVKAFFRTYAAACARADGLLFSLGDPLLLDGACRSAPFGKLMPEALYVHVDAVGLLPTPLRLYEGCARVFLGNVAGATLVKLRRDEPKVSYLDYPDFESDPHPALAHSLSVDLRTFRVRSRSYRAQGNPPVLHRKEEFLPEAHPLRPKFSRLTRIEVEKGLYADPAAIGTRDGWKIVLDRSGLELRGHRLVARRA